jgi:hypothetical protein
MAKIREVFYVHRTSPVSGIKIAAPKVLGQHIEHERIGEARKNIGVLHLLV